MRAEQSGGRRRPVRVCCTENTSCGVAPAHHAALWLPAPTPCSEGDREDGREDTSLRNIPNGVEIYEISGAFFFGAAEMFKDTLAHVAKRPKVLIIRMRDVSFLDSTGLRALRDVVRRGQRDRTVVLLSEIHAQPQIVVDRSPLRTELGEEQIFMTLEDALDFARAHMEARTPTPLATRAFPPPDAR